MKKYLTAFILALVLLTGSSLETKAQWVVHDPGHTSIPMAKSMPVVASVSAIYRR